MANFGDKTARDRQDGGGGLRVILAGGGTGGHLFCALAIAEGLRASHPTTQLLLVDAQGGIGEQAARRAGIPVDTVWVSGIERRLGLRQVARNLILPLKLAVSWLQARAILDRFRPDVVVGVGGYASFPVVAVAARAGIATLVHEANVLPGIANRLLGRQADAICLGFASAARYFPVGRTVLTGNPTRVGLTAAAAPPEARAVFGLAPAGRTVLVLGGSLGARRLNSWVLHHQAAFASRGVQVLWQCGRAHFAACHSGLTSADGVRLVPFVDDMAAAYASADLVVASAGALTLAELALLGKPAIIVPDRGVSEDHQSDNAAELQRQGAAICHVGQGEGEPGDDALFDLVASVVHDEDRLRALGTQMGKLGRPDAAAGIAAEVARLGVARQPGRQPGRQDDGARERPQG